MTTTETMPANLPASEEKVPATRLYMAVHKARAAMPTVKKSGRNTYDKYDYATLADYLEAIQKPLDDNGLIVVSHIDEITWMQDRETQTGKYEKVCRIMLRTTVIHAESGESMSVSVLGEGQDRGDKAFYKADTGARKYALANLFNLATDDDPETDSQDATPEQNGQRSNGRQSRETKPAQSSDVKSPANWPKSSDAELAAWADGLQSSTDFKAAVKLVSGPNVDPHATCLATCAIVTRYRVVLAAKSDAQRKAAEPFTKWIDDTLAAAQKADLDAQGKETFSGDTFAPPKDWPNTPTPDIVAWVTTLKTTAALKTALGMLSNEPTLQQSLFDWEACVNGVARRYKDLSKNFTRDRDSEIEKVVKHLMDQIAIDKEAAKSNDDGSFNPPAEESVAT